MPARRTRFKYIPGQNDPAEVLFKNGKQRYKVAFADGPNWSRNVTIYKEDEAIGYRPAFMGGRDKNTARHLLEQAIKDRVTKTA